MIKGQRFYPIFCTPSLHTNTISVRNANRKQTPSLQNAIDHPSSHSFQPIIMIRLSISSFAAVAIMLLDAACLHSAFYMGKAVHYRQLMLENHGNENEPLPETAISMKLVEVKILVERIGQKGNCFLDSVPPSEGNKEAPLFGSYAHQNLVLSFRYEQRQTK